MKHTIWQGERADIIVMSQKAWQEITEIIPVQKYERIMSPNEIPLRPKNAVIPMKASRVVTYLQDGYTLHTRWRYGKVYHYLAKSGLPELYIQKSNIKALIKQGVIGSILLSGDNVDYYLKQAGK